MTARSRIVIGPGRVLVIDPQPSGDVTLHFEVFGQSAAAMTVRPDVVRHIVIALTEALPV